MCFLDLARFFRLALLKGLDFELGEALIFELLFLVEFAALFLDGGGADAGVDVAARADPEAFVD
jgi:hypothetical protein